MYSFLDALVCLKGYTKLFVGLMGQLRGTAFVEKRAMPYWANIYFS
jgi:hypothetical protein